MESQGEAASKKTRCKPQPPCPLFKTIPCPGSLSRRRQIGRAESSVVSVQTTQPGEENSQGGAELRRSPPGLGLQPEQRGTETGGSSTWLKGQARSHHPESNMNSVPTKHGSPPLCFSSASIQEPVSILSSSDSERRVEEGEARKGDLVGLGGAWL